MRLALFKLAIALGALLAAGAISLVNYLWLIARLAGYLLAVGIAYSVLQHFVFHGLPSIL